MRLRHLRTSFLEMTPEQQLIQVEEIRKDRLIAKKPQQQAKSQKIKLKRDLHDVIEAMTPEDKAKFLGELRNNRERV